MSPGHDPKEALAALERLVNRHHLLSMEEARRAARLIANDPNLEFPPPRQAPAGEGTSDAARAAKGPPKPDGNGGREAGAGGETKASEGGEGKPGEGGEGTPSEGGEGGAERPAS